MTMARALKYSGLKNVDLGSYLADFSLIYMLMRSDWTTEPPKELMLRMTVSVSRKASSMTSLQLWMLRGPAQPTLPCRFITEIFGNDLF